MAGGICLPPQAVDKFKNALTSGKINPDEMSKMTSEVRHKFLAEIVGEGQAKFVNANFESKLLLKNQQQGYLTWAKKVVGVTPEVRRDLISKIERLDKVLNPAEEKMFLKDLAETKLGVSVSAAEAKKIVTMSTKLQELEAKRLPSGAFKTNSERMAYGYAKYDLGEHLANLKLAAEKRTLKEQALHPIESSSKAAGVTKAIRASLDNSAIFRQGWKTLWTNPIIWEKNMQQSFKNIMKVGFKNSDVVRETMADIISRPNYDKYRKMGLAIGNIEEAFPTALPGKIPVIGRAYKASEQAYESFLYKTRADVADKMLQAAEKTGVNLADKKQLSSIGKLINSLTGRGDLGRFEGTAASSINNIFFSIRFVKSNFDTLTAHQLQKGVTPFVRKQAAKNLAKVVIGTAAVLAIADHFVKGSVEWDPTSKDFGKIKIGHTRFDVSGGMGSIVVLAAQLVRNQEKSTSTGIVKKFGEGYGAKTGMDALNNFFEGKLSPAASVIKDLINRQDFMGNPITVAGEAKNLLVPLPITTALDAHNDPHSANKLLISIADGLGISTNTYGGSQKNYDLSTGKDMAAFKKKVGEDKFKQANKDYNAAVDNWMAANQKKLNSLPNSEQQARLTSAKNTLQARIYKKYGFTPPKSNKPSGAAKSLLDSAKTIKI